MKSVRRKILLFGLTAMMSVNLAACGSKEESTSGTTTAGTTTTTTAAETVAETEGNDGDATTGGIYTAGTYTATTKGNNGDVTLEVTFDSDAIKSIEIKEHGETPGISDAPIAKIPELIIANQSLNIDAITGATNTSNAILNAVADAVNQAGGDAEALKKVEVADNAVAGEAVEKEADVIVVGAGGAGLAAAVSAAEEGASVIVIEKNPYIGGNTVRTGDRKSVV